MQLNVISKGKGREKLGKGIKTIVEKFGEIQIYRGVRILRPFEKKIRAEKKQEWIPASRLARNTTF